MRPKSAEKVKKDKRRKRGTGGVSPDSRNVDRISPSEKKAYERKAQFDAALRILENRPRIEPRGKTRSDEQKTRKRQVRQVSSFLTPGGFILEALKNAPGEASEIARGTPAAMIGLARASKTDYDSLLDFLGAPAYEGKGKKGSALYRDVVKPQGAYYKGRYADPILEKGPLGLYDIQREFAKKPVSGTLDLGAAASLGAGTVAKPLVFRAALKQGATPKTALRATRVAPRPKDLIMKDGKPYARPRNLSVAEGGVIVHPPSSASTLTRYFQDLYDDASESFPSAPLIGANTRGAKVKAREFKQDQERKIAGAVPLAKSIGRISFDPVKDRRLRARLYWEAQLPEGAGDAGLQAVLADLRAEKARPGPVRHRDQARNTYREKYRQKRLDQKISQLESALKQPPNKAYREARDALQILSDERKTILIESGLLDSAGAVAREGLITKHLFGDEAEGGGAFVTHRTGGKYKLREFVGGRLGGGPTDKRGLGVGKQNQLILYREGRNLVDPDLVVLSWHRAQVFDFHNRVKQFLFDAGKPVGPDGPEPGAYLVNPHGKATPGRWKDVEEGDPEALRSTVAGYIKSYIGKEGEADTSFFTPDGELVPGIRQVDPRIVHQFMNELVGPGTAPAIRAAGRWVDIANGLVRLSLLYANPGYIPANLIANMGLLGLHQGAFAVPNLMRSGRKLATDRELSRLVRAEVGQGPTLAMAPDVGLGGTRVSQRILNAEQTVARKVGAVPDVWPRMAAWEYEARRMGFKSREQQIHLLQSDDPLVRQTLNNVSARANEAMINFQRLGPIERAFLKRVAFVWPFIRGAAAWAGRFPKEYPVRASLLANAAEREGAEGWKTLGAMPASLAQAVPLGPVRNGIARVSNPASFTPTGVAFEVEQTVEGLVRGLVKNEPPPKYRTLGSYINPAIDFVYNVLGSKSPYGQEIGTRDALIQNAQELSPLYRLKKELGGDVPPVYVDDSRLGTVKRRVLRGTPMDIRVDVAHKQAAEQRRAGPKSEATKYTEWETEAKSVWKQAGNDTPLPMELVRAKRNSMLVSLTGQKLKENLGISKLSEKQELAVMVGVLAAQYPENREAWKREVASANPTAVNELLPIIRRRLGGAVLQQYGRLRSRADLVSRQKAYAQ